MRRDRFAAGEYYHVYCHSVGDLKLFREKRDYERFVSLLFVANGSSSVPRLDRTAGFQIIDEISEKKISLGDPLVSITCFCIMPTHIHMLLGEPEGKRYNNISRYVHKVLVIHSKFLNTKYERRGHVFESTFHARHIDSNRYLLYASRYIHKNPKDVKPWSGKEVEYPWSTYQDYVKENRFGSLLERDIVLDQFANPAEYHEYADEPLNEDEFDPNLV